MSKRVGWILVLIENVRTRKIFLELKSNTDVRANVVKRHFCWCSDNGRAKGSKNVRLFLRHFFWEGNNHVIPLGGSSHGKTNTCVAAGRLNKSITFLDSSTDFSINDHSSADSILH